MTSSVLKVMLSPPVCFSYIKGEDDVVTSNVLLIYKRGRRCGHFQCATQIYKGKTMLSPPVCFSYIKGEDDVVTSNVLLIYKRGRGCGHFQCASHI